LAAILAKKAQAYGKLATHLKNFYSLIVSAKENRLVPFEYLTKVFTEAPNGAHVKDLMPWRL
jgi:hypothetical protein